MKLWTVDFLAFVLPLTPDQVLRVEGPHPSPTPASRQEWAWIQTAQRLAWQYGPVEAVRRLNGRWA